ncbi:hypothetical protein BIY29_00990 [Brenneria alni]|uniref:Uncharacterized protein n=1 Tax=Brenneria alni TaxID=71656 RepID=A0A421DU78_9GAMM|nr:hypothetical protein [Brenneria alni]RLM28260.1 hypothetical protein BIY29_00990 [Brenneria alni]
MSPFTHLALDIGLTDFLDYIEPRLAADSAVLYQRQAFLERLRSIPATLPSDCIETMPIMPNYFFNQFNLLLTHHSKQGRCTALAQMVPVRKCIRSFGFERTLAFDGLGVVIIKCVKVLATAFS